MKSGRSAPRARREQLLDDPRNDAYKLRAKPPGPSRCPECGATFQRGRWTWNALKGSARELLCPACRRIAERYPAGYVTLRGPFFAEHRDEIVRLARRCEEIEKSEHPLQRIMAIERNGDGVLVTTTDTHLARIIAEKIHAAYKGKLSLRYNKEDNLLRAEWER